MTSFGHYFDGTPVMIWSGVWGSFRSDERLLIKATLQAEICGRVNGAFIWLDKIQELKQVVLW